MKVYTLWVKLSKKFFLGDLNENAGQCIAFFQCGGTAGHTVRMRDRPAQCGTLGNYVPYCQPPTTFSPIYNYFTPISPNDPRIKNPCFNFFPPQRGSSSAVIPALNFSFNNSK